MKRVVIAESALREFLNDTMSSYTTNSHLSKDMPVRINPVVAPDAAEVDPANANFVPQNKAELLSALRVMCDLEDDKVPAVYIAIEDAMKDQEETMNKNSVEESIRSSVRQVLRSLVKEHNDKKQPKDPFHSVRMQVRKFIAEASYEKRREAGDRVWAGLPPVTGDLPPVRKIPYGTGAKTGTPEEQRTKYEKNVGQLQKQFRGMEMLDNEELVTATSFFTQTFDDLNFDEAAEAYALAFNEAKETYEEEGLAFETDGSFAAILTGKLFKELFEAYSSFDFEEYVAKLGDRARKIISEDLSKKKKNVENKLRSYAASDVTQATLEETATELELSISMIKKIENRALGVLVLGMKAGDDLDI